MKKRPLLRRLGNQKGVTIILVAISLVALIGIAALAIDLGYFYVVKGELQNAADSGALAGAQVLYITVPAGVQVNSGANQTALDLVSANYSEQASVSVKSIERGHWSFATREFTPNDSLLPVSLWNVTTAELDADPNFINAVRVITKRKIVAGTGMPEEPFFARIFGSSGPSLEATAVAYIGFAGTLTPGEADQPIAICKQGITDPTTGEYTCGVGRMINSGSNDGHQTGGWTNFSQPCETASTSSVRPLVCADGNPDPIVLGQGMGTTGGELQSAFDRMIDCWQQRADIDGDDGIPDHPWSITLPVIDCPGNNTGNCSTVVGAVELNIVWMTRTDKNQFAEVPRTMYNPSTNVQWNCSTTGTTKEDGQLCWSEFATDFQLKDVLNQSPAFYEDKTMYFIPDCTPHIPAGTTGGQNFGILARIPVLVK